MDGGRKMLWRVHANKHTFKYTKTPEKMNDFHGNKGVIMFTERNIVCCTSQLNPNDHSDFTITKACLALITSDFNRK